MKPTFEIVQLGLGKWAVTERFSDSRWPRVVGTFEDVFYASMLLKVAEEYWKAVKG